MAVSKGALSDTKNNSQVRGLEGLQQEHQREAVVMHRSALGLLEQVEAGLESCNLGHMLAVTSPRR